MKQQAQDNITSVFQHLSWIEKFVMKAFLTNIHAGNTINETRLSLRISATSHNLLELPPCKNALELHIMRSAYQAGWIWGNTLSQQQPLPTTSWDVQFLKTEPGCRWYGKYMSYTRQNCCPLLLQRVNAMDKTRFVLHVVVVNCHYLVENIVTVEEFV